MQNNQVPRILFDGNSLIYQKTGVGHFALRLLTSLAQQNVKIVVFYYNFLGRHKIADLPTSDNVTYREIKFMPPKLLGLLNRRGIELPLELITDTKRFSYSIFPNFVSMPSLRKLPSLLAVHDMSMYDVPEFVEHKNLIFLRKILPRSIHRSASILTISEFTKSRIIGHFPDTTASKIIVVPIPYEQPSVSHKEQPSSFTKEVVENNKYILHVGTIEPRKNIAALIDGYLASDDALRRKYKLVLMGKRGWMSQDVLKKITENSESIQLLGYTTDYERDYVYKNASLVCQLSFYEGFGMPLLEAGHYNKPLVLSDIPVFKEIAKKHAIFCDPSKPSDVAKAIERAFVKTEWHTSDLNSGISWEKNCKRILANMSKHSRDT